MATLVPFAARTAQAAAPLADKQNPGWYRYPAGIATRWAASRSPS
jgi:hypothetical protein